ncbi:MAG: prepilin-type N-terminal cleavage/methylation domain-containing protein [Deltaproteobacteria bacterium]|nr:prepilin-type N-terminal cleavage/methylation domain-containing protein [Deltaproteobacteria bacterium]
MAVKVTQQGFTLLEVVIAVAITALLLTTVYSVFSSTSRARMRAEELSGHVHGARVFFDRISRELRGSNWSAANKDTSFIVKAEDEGFKEMSFTTSAAIILQNTPADGAKVRYAMEKDTGDLWSLYRVTSSAEESGSGEAESFLILSDVVKMEMRFYHNGAWFEQWNAEDEKRLPKQVEITLTVRSGDRELPFATTVDIPLSGG